MIQESITAKVASAIRDACERGWTVQQIATSAGFSRGYISQVKHGRRPNLGIESAERILRAIGRKLEIAG